MQPFARWCVLFTTVFVVHATARDYQVFDVVGDSISAGVNPECGGYGWVNMLFGESGCGLPATTNALTNLWPAITRHNSAAGGSKARDWAWAQTNLMQTVSNHHPDLVVVFIGGNDGLEYAQDGVYTEAEREEYRTNLISIVQQLRNNNPIPDIVLVNYYDLFDGFSTNLPSPYEGYRVLSPAVTGGNAMIEGIAESNGCFFADIHSPFMHHAYGEALGDTQHLSPAYVRMPLTPSTFDIHPVTAGHAAICEHIYRVLAELKEIPKVTGIQGADGQIMVHWRSGIGQSYVIRQSTDLRNGFSALVTNMGTPTRNTYTSAVESAGRAFFRVETP